jgi:hypothetical protein
VSQQADTPRCGTEIVFGYFHLFLAPLTSFPVAQIIYREKVTRAVNNKLEGPYKEAVVA